MGYYSDVAWYIEGEQDELDALLMEHRLNHGELSKYLVEYLNTKTPGLITFEVCDVKWYEAFNDVKWCSKLLILAEEHGLSGMFVRIGEETDDTEYTTYGDNCSYRLSITRNIVSDF